MSHVDQLKRRVRRAALLSEQRRQLAWQHQEYSLFEDSG